ncbi:VanZ family protein [bacterium]|nr:VanZ family protein [bacterium]
MPNRTVIFSFSLFYTLVITTLSLVQLDDIPKLNTGFDDKIAHFLCYAILCLMWFLSFYSFKIKRSLFAASAFSILFGLIIEIIQSQATVHRTAEVLDFLANTMGALAMTILIYLKKKVIIKNL